MQTQQLPIDDIITIAFDIFDEMATDNLEFADLADHEKHFEEQGAAITVEPSDDWLQHIADDGTLSEMIEVQIGLAPENELTTIFARILLSRHADNKFCHILWKDK